MVSTMQSSPLKFGKRFNRYCDATGHGWRRGEKQVWSVVERYPAMRLLRLFDDADAYDQKRNQTLSLLRLHEGPETWLEELQNQVRVGRRDREVRGRQGRHVAHDAALVDEVVEQAKVQSERELVTLATERDQLMKELEYWNEAIRIAAPRSNRIPQFNLAEAISRLARKPSTC